MVRPDLERPELGNTRARYVFRFGYRDRTVTLQIREGFVTDEQPFREIEQGPRLQGSPFRPRGRLGLRRGRLLHGRTQDPQRLSLPHWLDSEGANIPPQEYVELVTKAKKAQRRQ